MMMDSRTNWRKVCAIHEISALVPAWMASGRLINAIMAKT
jgi:hypothetical protein